MIQLFQIQGLFPNVMQEGFSAYKASISVSSGTMITSWSVEFPSFTSSNFNAATGIYTVPVTGIYAMQAIISYTTNTAITTQLGTNINPALTISKTSPTVSDLIIGRFPIFNTDMAILTLRTILASSTVTLSGVVHLTEGDALGLFYNADSMSLSLTMNEIRWAAYRLK